MQNAGQQYGQGAATSHQGAPGTPYGHSETSSSSTGSITSSLRQFRKKDVDKQQVNDTTTTTTGESHVARVAPHNHYPPRTNENYRYPPQFPDYSLTPQVKYSEISNLHPLQEPVTPSVIQKPKPKDYMDMCNVQQSHMKQGYPDHLNGQQYAAEPNLHPHHQYAHKDHQIHPIYKPESQYFPKEAQYQQLSAHQMQKYNMQTQMRKYPPENDFLSKLRRIHPSMARSIMSDHHLQESQGSYQPMDQNRMYPHQNQRYMNYAAPLQANPYPHNYMPPQNYPNYQASCSYNRPSQIPPRFPPINPHERSISPRRNYSENLIPPMNYTALPQKISPSYPQYNTPEYAQHYQHRRAPQEYYQPHCRSTQYLPHQMTQQEITESRVTVSDSIKQYIENWADEETASEMTQIESNRLCKETLRVRDDQTTETVYMINASELQYLENGIPLVTSENGIPLVTSENGQYIIKSGVAIDNTTGMVRIMDKSNQIESTESGERVVNLHIMDTFKPDCMLASKPKELNQRQEENLYHTNDKPKVVIHQNAIIQPSQQSVFKEIAHSVSEALQAENKVGNSLPIITDSDLTQTDPLEKLEETIFKECKKETADKNCSPINVKEIEAFEDFKEHVDATSVICATASLEQSDIDQVEELEDATALKNMPIIELMTAGGNIDKSEEEVIPSKNNDENESEIMVNGDLIIESMNGQFEEQSSPKDKENDKIDAPAEEIKSTVPTNESVIDDDAENEKLAAEQSIEKECTDNVEQLIQFDNDCFTDEDDIKENIDNEKEDGKIIEHMDIDKIVEERAEENTEVATEDIAEPVKLDEVTEIKETIVDKDGDDVKSDPTEILSTNTTAASEEEAVKPKRSKRIFSVDDIINNIGINIIKTKSETEILERRRSLYATREFLENEISYSSMIIFKPVEAEHKNNDEPFIHKETDEKCIPDQLVQEKCETTEGILEVTGNTDIDINKTADDGNVRRVEIVESPVTQVNETADDHTVAILKIAHDCNVESLEVTENPVEEVNETVDDSTKEANDKTCNTNTNSAESETKPDLNTSNTNNDSPLQNLVQSTTESCEKNCDNVITDNAIDNKSNSFDVANIQKPISEKPVEKSGSCEAESEVSSALNEDEESTNNEVQYRNAIRVEENNVLLEIAGELVEINVITVNGKKVITVVPLSETTVVDCNDNYETVENSDEIETQTKTSTIATDPDDAITAVAAVEEVVPETEVIESTSEIIIGMDISLEEEIQLDLEKPPVLCTKAAKKAYENDLQIPSITTSEDINDDNKTECYDNDKVSSSKEQVKEKKDRSDKIHSSSKLHEVEETQEVSEKQDSDSKKKGLKELLKVRKVKKPEIRAKTEEEDFIPFKDLVKARHLKKQKLQHQKSSENVSADSTNKIEHEESHQNEGESIEKIDDKINKKEDSNKSKLTDVILVKTDKSKCKNRSHKNYRTSSSSEDKVENSPEKNNSEDKVENSPEKNSSEDKVENSPEKHKSIEDTVDALKSDPNKVNSNTGEKSEIECKNAEKCAKKVTFGAVNYKKIDTDTKPCKPQIKNYKLEDPRLKKRPGANVVVPSVSEILKENAVVENGKKKLSLEEYNRRKRKLSTAQEEVNTKKINIEEKTKDEKCAVAEKPAAEGRKFILHRPKSLEDVKDKPRDAILAKRKFSLEESFCRPNYLDWEDTQSPKTNQTSRDKTEKRLSEFSGLIDNNKSKIVIDINDLHPKPTIAENSEDEVLQTYKEQVDSKLSSLNIQIPRVAKFSNPETNNLIERFLNNEKITLEEMEKIKRIISYKRMVQQLNKIKTPEPVSAALNPSYEIRKDGLEKDMKLHLKKVPDKKKKKRFMNLHSDSTSDSGSDFSENKDTTGDYSVVQSECMAAAGVPKLIIKRKTEMPVPVVRLERLDLDLLVAKKRKIY